MFLIGASADEPSSLVEDELEEHDDILLGDFVDSFHNLTFKDSMFFTWTIVVYKCEACFEMLSGST